MANTPSIIFDERTGKASATRGVGDATRDLVDKYNGLIDELALFGDTDVTSHLLYDTNVSGKPSAVQNLIGDIRKFLERRLKQAQKDDQAGAEATLIAQSAQLTEDFDQQLAAIRDRHEQEHEQELATRDAQVRGHRQGVQSLTRLDLYIGEVYRTIAQLCKLTGRPASSPLGAVPLGPLHYHSDGGAHKVITIGPLMLAVTAHPVGDDGILHDTIIVGSIDDDSGTPDLVEVSLELRRHDRLPGLTPRGRQQLEQAMQALTLSFFVFARKNFTPTELAEIYGDPAAARAYFDQLELDGGISAAFARMAKLRGITVEHINPDDPAYARLHDLVHPHHAGDYVATGDIEQDEPGANNDTKE